MASFQGRVQVHGDGVPNYDARPNIHVDVTVSDVSRSGGTLSATCTASIVGLGGASYFGFDLAVGFSIDNDSVHQLFAKGNSPSQWGSGAYSGSATSSASNSSTSCTLKIWTKSVNCGCTGSYGNGVWKVVWSKSVSAPAANHTYTFNPNGGSGGPTSATKTQGVDFTFPTSKPTRTNYLFTGWNNTSINGGTLYQPGQTVGGLPDSDVEWWANWKLNAWTVTYNANGGSGAPSSQDKIYNQTLILNTSGPSTPKKARLTYDARGGSVSPSYKDISLDFTGWNTNSAGTGTSYAPGGSYTRNEAVTLYAQWGSGVIGSLPTPTRSDCEFIGWYTDPEGGSKVDSNYRISGYTTLYAHYNYTIHYDCDGGEPESLPDQVKKHEVNLTLTSMKPWKLGMELKGWATTRGGSISYYPGGTYANNDTATLYAVYGTAEYTVRFEDGYTGAILKTEQVKAGGAATPPPAPKREGYDFVGWMGEYKCVYRDSVVYAMWSTCPVYVMNNKHEWVKLWDYIKLKEK